MKGKLFGITILLAFLLASPSLFAQTVGYTHKALAAEGCSMKYSISKLDSAYYIIATVKSDRLTFLKEPVLMIRTFNDDVIKITGSNIGNGSESGGVLVGNVVVPITEISSTAQFPVTPEQLEMIKSGVAKIRLSTTPIVHEKSFRKDKIGAKLYKFYINVKEKDDTF